MVKFIIQSIILKYELYLRIYFYTMFMPDQLCNTIVKVCQCNHALLLSLLSLLSVDRAPDNSIWSRDFVERSTIDPNKYASNFIEYVKEFKSRRQIYVCFFENYITFWSKDIVARSSKGGVTTLCLVQNSQFHYLD